MTLRRGAARTALRRGLARLAAGLVLACLAAAELAAQEGGGLTTLVADTVTLDGRDRLVAEGNVEAFSRGAALRADRLSYDRRTERITATGDVTLQDADGTVLLADGAELDRDLAEGIIQGARLILDERLQIAAAQSIRRGGRFLDNKQVTASSCRVCARGDTPLWEIRARRVIHDEAEAQIYFYGARFRIFGVPVLYLPALRVPDGTEDRVEGFLPPRFVASSDLGNGVELPYFLPLGDHADLTLLPYLSGVLDGPVPPPDDGDGGDGDAENPFSRTLGLRYRQAFVAGDIEINAALSQDSLEDGTRGYVFADGAFDLPADFTLDIGLEAASDDAYLSDYGISNSNFRRNDVVATRVQDLDLVEASLLQREDQRADRADEDEPDLIVDTRWQQRYALAGGLGGWVDLDLVADAFRRRSNENVIGRDRAQFRATAAWQNTWTLPAGLRFGGQGRLNADLRQLADDDRFDATQAALTPEVSATLSWPLAKQGARALYLLEPVAQLAWVAPDTLEGPNDDSTEVEFGVGNLFSLNRFPGLDRYEEGGRANLGLRWSRTGSGGVSLGLTGGRVLRFDERDQFGPATGLDGRRSDWVTQVDIDYADTLAFRQTTLVDDSGAATRSETRLELRGDRASLSSSYIFQSEEAGEGFDDDISELAAEAEWDIGRTWIIGALVRHDFAIDRTNYRELRLGYRNECVRLDLSAVERFRRTQDTSPVTEFSFTVELAGLGASGREPRRACGA